MPTALAPPHPHQPLLPPSRSPCLPPQVRTYDFPPDIEPWRLFEAVHKDELRYMPYVAEVRSAT
jgi:hypothetical protein